MKNIEIHNESGNANIHVSEKRDSLLSLDSLQTFEQIRIPLGADFGERIVRSGTHVALLVDSKEERAAQTYKQLIEIPDRNVSIHVQENPMHAARMLTVDGIIPIVINSAIDPRLKDMMFHEAGFGELLADSFPMQEGDGTPVLHCVGITKHGIRQLGKSDDHVPTQELTRRRNEQILNVIRDVVTPEMFHGILQSDRIRKIHVHALGPEGTNISQAAKLFVDRLMIGDKTHIIVHGAGITPLTYAEIAAEETRRTLVSGRLPDELHLHVECAVYNNMGTLYASRKNESIFVDTQDMALDVMQLASDKGIDELESIVKTKGVVRIAAHPSPEPLVRAWIDRGVATWIEASSNAAAAHMTLNGEADACITTATTVARLESRHIQTIHEFGSPNMIFTIASPLATDQLQKLFKERI